MEAQQVAAVLEHRELQLRRTNETLSFSGVARTSGVRAEIVGRTARLDPQRARQARSQAGLEPPGRRDGQAQTGRDDSERLAARSESCHNELVPWRFAK